MSGLEECFWKESILFCGEYLERELRIRNEILDRLKNAPNAEKRAGEIEEEKQAVIAALEEYEGI